MIGRIGFVVMPCPVFERERERDFASFIFCCCCVQLLLKMLSLLLSLLQFVGDVGMKLVMHFHQSSNIFRVNRESFLLQVGGSCQRGGDIRLNGLKAKESLMV